MYTSVGALCMTFKIHYSLRLYNLNVYLTKEEKYRKWLPECL